MRFSDIEEALERFRKGDPVIVVDAVSRENEGDIVFPADTATQEKINFCASRAKGLVCLAMDQSTADRLELRPLNSNKSDRYHTAFYDPIDASHQHGVTTGISASDRAVTAKLVTDPASRSSDFIKPGHLFPVVAKPFGLLQREGHTEAGVDLCRLTGHYPAAIICEIMNEDGTMMRRDGLLDFALRHQLPIISIQQILDHRKQSEQPLDQVSTASLPTEYGDFTVHVFRNRITEAEHVVLQQSDRPDRTPLVRIHSECITGDVFSSLRCDCKDQLHKSMKKIREHGHGLLIYLKGHEGRGIGISNKIAAYAIQEKGMNTFEANEHLGLPRDSRSYQDAAWILRHFGMHDIDLITNNAEKVNTLLHNQIKTNTVSVHSAVNPHNKKYLLDKITIAHHNINLEQ